MDVRVKFLGGAQSVTGSRFLLEFDKFRVLVDCGLFQGTKELRLRNWEWLPIDTFKVDSIILTHAQLDHSGYLPRLYRSGYQGSVHCTAATAALLEVLLKDSAILQMEEAAWARKKGYSRYTFPRPLYDLEDVDETLPHVKASPWDTAIRLSDRVSFRFIPSGHTLGAASIVFEVQGNHQTKTLVFSGDLGQQNHPIQPPPSRVQQADVLFVESTYGHKNHPDEPVRDQLANCINNTFERGGAVLVPAFTVGRAQDLLFYLDELIKAGKIDEVPVFIDSPMANRVPELYHRFHSLHKLNRENRPTCVFANPNFKYLKNQKDSVQVNQYQGPCIIISPSGMCSGGRVLHHLYHRLRDARNTVVLPGIQGKGTRGRALQDGNNEVKIFGVKVPVKAKVETINGLSAHADQAELLQWMSEVNEAPKYTFCIHGEVKGAQMLKCQIQEQFEWSNVIIPHYLESLVLFEGI